MHSSWVVRISSQLALIGFLVKRRSLVILKSGHLSQSQEYFHFLKSIQTISIVIDADRNMLSIFLE